VQKVTQGDVQPGEMPAATEASDSPLDDAMMTAISSIVEKRTAELAEQFQGKSKALNHELASLRKKLKRQQEPEAEAQAASQAGLSKDDVSALIRVGQLSANLPAETVERIRGLDLSPTQEAAILDAIAAGNPSKSADNRQARDAREINRGATAAPRNSAALPTTQREYLAMRKSDPQRYAQLANDPAFDPTDLPMR
jgi:hypothetical protein